MILRLLSGASLLLLGYYIGREVGRSEPIRRELQEARDADNAPSKKPSPTSPASKSTH